jgi:hypothetical protein
VAPVRKAADEIRITIFSKSFGVKKINELVITSNKFTNNFSGLVTSCLGPDMARGPPVFHADVERTTFYITRTLFIFNVKVNKTNIA